MIRRAVPAGAYALLMLAACGGSTSTTATPPASAPASAPAVAPAAGALPVHLSDFKIDPSSMSAMAGAISFAVKNDGPTPHNLTVIDASGRTVGATKDLKPGESAILTVTLAAGTYSVICSLPGHASLGMKNPLTVT